MRRLLLSLSAVALVSGIWAVPNASAQQSFNIYLGGFVPHDLDARGTTNSFGVSDDVIVNDNAFLATFNRNTGIDMRKFNGATVGGEWLVDFGRYLQGGVGLGFYQRTVPTYDIFNFNGTTGDDVTADLKLRIVPFTATVRFLPLGHAAFEPYIGAGVGVNYFRYSETGQFVDYGGGAAGPCPGCDIITGSFSGSGWATGPVVLGGVRINAGPIAPGFEMRYQAAEGKLPSDQGFAGPKIDLGGMNYLFTLNIRF